MYINLIILLFNGNLILPTRQNNFNKFLEYFNQKVKSKKVKFNIVEPIQSIILPNINNYWLTGFTDAEGCFTVSFLSNSNAFRLRFIITQKGDSNLPILSHFILLFNSGTLEAHSIKSNFSYILSGVKACYNIYTYFDKYTLKTKKLQSYNLWKEIHNQINNKDHLNLELRNHLIEKAKKVNSIKRKSK